MQIFKRQLLFWVGDGTCKLAGGSTQPAHSQRAASDLAYNLAFDINLCRTPATEAGADAAADAGDAIEALPSAISRLDQQLGAERVNAVCDACSSALSVLARCSDQKPSDQPVPPAPDVPELAGTLRTLGPMLRMLRGGVQRTALRALSHHRATSKLTYVCAALMAGLVEEGFCMPQGTEDGGWGRPCNTREHMCEVGGWVEGPECFLQRMRYEGLCACCRIGATPAGACRASSLACCQTTQCHAGVYLCGFCCCRKLSPTWSYLICDPTSFKYQTDALGMMIVCFNSSRTL